MTHATSHKKHSSAKKIIATTGILLGVGALVAGGAFAIFTSSDSASMTADAGGLNVVMRDAITVGKDVAPGDMMQRIMPATLAKATNNGSLIAALDFSYSATDVGATPPPLASGAPTPSASPASSLVSALKFRIRTCSVAWTATTTSVTTALATPQTEATAASGWSCTGVETAGTSTATVAAVASGGSSASAALLSDWAVNAPIRFTAVNIMGTATGATTANGTFDTATNTVVVYPMLELTLPVGTQNEYQNSGTTITITATAIQRDGIQK